MSKYNNAINLLQPPPGQYCKVPDWAAVRKVKRLKPQTGTTPSILNLAEENVLPLK